MNPDINLLPSKKGNIFSSEQTLARVRILAVVCVVLLISSGVGIFLLAQVNSPISLKTQQATLTNTLLQSKDKAVAQLQLIDRLNHIRTIINNRSTLENNIILVQKQIPSNVNIVSLSLDDKVLTLSVTSSDLTAVDKVITNMTALLQTQKFIKKMTVDDVVADQKTGDYLLSIDATL